MKRYLPKWILRGMVAQYIDIVNYRIHEDYMCHIERLVSGRDDYTYNGDFAKLLERHGVSRTGSLEYVGADAVRRTPNQNVRNKNALRLTFLLLLDASGQH